MSLADRRTIVELASAISDEHACAIAWMMRELTANGLDVSRLARTGGRGYDVATLRELATVRARFAVDAVLALYGLRPAPRGLR